MGANKKGTNLDAGLIASLVSMGHTVTVNADGGFVVGPANANEAKPKANKPAAKKTTPAEPKPNGFMQWRADTRVARDKLKAHKAAGRIAYGKSYNQLVEEKVITKAGNLTAAHKAGKASKTTYTVELNSDAKALMDKLGIAYTA